MNIKYFLKLIEAGFTRGYKKRYFSIIPLMWRFVSSTIILTFAVLFLQSILISNESLMYKNEIQRYISSLIVGTAVFQFIWGAVWGMGDELVNERNNKTLEILLTCPCNVIYILLGHALFESLDSGIFFMYMILIGKFLFGLNIASEVNLPILSLGVVLCVTSLIGFGIFFAAFCLFTRHAHIFQSFFNLVFMFLSGAWFPIDILPKPLIIIANILPVSHAVNVVRSPLLENITINDILFDVMVLLFYTMIMPIICYLIFRYVENYMQTKGEYSFI